MTTTKQMTRLILIPLFCLLLAPPQSARTQEAGKEKGAKSESGESTLWEVRSSVGRVFLLGSIHFAREDIYPLDEEITKAFRESQCLVVEANVNNAQATESVPALLGQAFYPPGDSLARHISQATYQKARERYESNDLPMLTFDQYKPWFLAATLLSVELKELGVTSELGLDKYFLERTQGKKVLELESIQDQLEIFNGFNDREQELFLHTTLQDLEELPSKIDEMLAAWKNGDVDRLERFLTRHLNDSPQVKSLYHKLITLRNFQMLAKIESYLRAKQTFFVVVGAGHLVGDQGIVNLLKSRKKYYIKQL